MPSMRSGTVGLLIASGVADLALTAAFYMETHHWDFDSLPLTLPALQDFHSDALDLLAACAFRAVIVLLLTWLAVTVGLPGEPPPLATTDDPDARTARDASAKDLQQMADRRRHVVVGVIFTFITVFSVWTAIKSVSFEYSREAIQGPLIIALVAFINAEFYFARAVVERFTKEEGLLVPQLHNHPVYFAQVNYHYCDLCWTRIERDAYRCRYCDFDICVTCFRKGNKSTSEGLLRGDKGIHEELEVSNLGYFWRAILLTRPFFHIVLVAFGCLLVNQGTRLLLPQTQGAILDSVIRTDRGAFTRNIQMYILYSVLTGLFGAIRSLCVDIVGKKMSNEVSNKLFGAIVTQDIAFFDGNNTGQLTARITNDAQAMVNPMRTMLNTLLSNLMLLIGGIAMCFFTSWRLSMVAFTSMGPIVFATQLYAKWSKQLNRQIWDAMAKANQVATEAFSNIRTVRAFSTEGQERAKYEGAMDESLRCGIRDAVVGAGTYAFTNYVDLGAGVLVLWYGGLLVMSHEDRLTAGKLITFQLYWNMMNDSWKNLNDIVSSFTRAAGAAQRVISLMELKPDIDPNAGTKLEKVTGELKLENVDYTYQMRPDAKVLSNVSITIPPNTMLALVGRSGGGKSTIVHLLMRFYDPKAGRITLDGVDYTSLNVKWLHDQMGLVAQDTQLFGTTIEENITYGLEHYTQEQMVAAAKLANAHEFISGFEDGYGTRVGERGVRLSGGQKQRIAIARILLRKPKLLLLDEATSALDTESEAQVQQAIDRLIQTLHGGCTVVVIAHRLSTVMNADKIAVIDGGTVVEEGTHEELLAVHGVYHKLAVRQLKRTDGHGGGVIGGDDDDTAEEAAKAPEPEPTTTSPKKPTDDC